MQNNTKIAIESQQKADEQNTFEINIFYLLLVWLLHSVHACTHNERIIYIMYKFNDVTLLAAIAVQIFLSSTRFLIYKIKVFCFFFCLQLLSTITASQRLNQTGPKNVYMMAMLMMIMTTLLKRNSENDIRYRKQMCNDMRLAHRMVLSSLFSPAKEKRNTRTAKTNSDLKTKYLQFQRK